MKNKQRQDAAKKLISDMYALESKLNQNKFALKQDDYVAGDWNYAKTMLTKSYASKTDNDQEYDFALGRAYEDAKEMYDSVSESYQLRKNTLINSNSPVSMPSAERNPGLIPSPGFSPMSDDASLKTSSATPKGQVRFSPITMEKDSKTLGKEFVPGEISKTPAQSGKTKEHDGKRDDNDDGTTSPDKGRRRGQSV